MSTNAGAIESSSDAVVSSEPPSNSDIAVSKGVTVVVGAESLDSRTETLTTEPSSGGVIVQDLADDARVSGGEAEIVKDNDEKVLNESSSDAVASSEPPSNGGIDVSKGVVVGTDSLDSKTETLTTQPSSCGIIFQDLVDNDRVSGDEIRTVMDKDEKVFDASSSDVVDSSVLPVASNEVKIGDELLESKSGTLIMETSDHDGGGDIVAQDLIDDTKVSRDGIGTVTVNSELVLDKPISDAVVSPVPLSNIHIDAVNGVKIGAGSLDSKTETLAMKPSADQNGGDDVQDSIDNSRVPGDEKGIAVENIEKVSDEKEVNNEEIERDHNEGGDIAVKDSIDNSRVSGDEKGIIIGTIEKVSDENEVNNEEKEGEYNGGVDIAVQDSIDDSGVSGDEKGILMENIEKASNEDEVNNEEKEGEYNGGGDIALQDSVDDSRVSGDETGIVTDDIEKGVDENEVSNEEREGEYKVTDLVWAKVKNYPWWPGQIFDPSSSTDIAKKHSNKKGFLVGYFGDQSFAWNKASKIKPFRKNFCKLEKQSNSKAFLHAVNCALDEVSRRVDFGLACSCLSKEVCDKVKSQVFVNAGIRKEASKIDGGDRFSTVSTFKPVKVVQSVQELAREHFDGFSRLEVLSVRTQLLAFFRWKGYYQFQAQNILDGLDSKLEDESDPLTEENKVVEDEKPASVDKKVLSKKRKPDVSDSDDSVPRKKERSLTNVTPKGNSSVEGRKKNISNKATVEDEKPASVGKKGSSKKRKPDVSDSDDSVPRKKDRSLTNVTPKGNSSVKGSKKNISKKATVEDEEPASVGKKVSSKKKPDVSDSDSVSRKKERSLTNVTPKGNSSAKGSKKNISKNATVEDNVLKEENENEKQASVGKKVSSKKRKPDDCDRDDSVPRKKERSLSNMIPKGNSIVKRSKKSISKKATGEDNVIKDENGNGTDGKKSSISSPKKLFRVGDSICRIAKQISESPSILKKESQKS